MRSQYDVWLDAEKKKIHDKYEAEREKIQNEMFLNGFNNACNYQYQGKQELAESSKKLAEIDAAETKEINDFMMMIDGNWSNYVDSVLGNK